MLSSRRHRLLRCLMMCAVLVWASFLGLLILMLLDNAALVQSNLATNFISSQTQSSLLYVQGAGKPDADLTSVPQHALDLRAEFGEMELCTLPRTWYMCRGNPSCIVNDTCEHYPDALVQFRDMHVAPLRFIAQQKERRKALRGILQRMEHVMGGSSSSSVKDKRIFLMTLNSGFSFLFGNWYCSLLERGVDVDRVKRETMVLARDVDALKYVTSLGFFAPTLEELQQLQQWTGKPKEIRPKAAPVFGQGQHSTINMFVKFGMPLDLLSLGYTVAVQDVDFVWHKYPFDDIAERCKAKDCHGIFISEGRWFYHGENRYSPYHSDRGKLIMKEHKYDPEIIYHRGGRDSIIPEVNTGLFWISPNAETIHFFEVLIQGVFLQQWKRRDQMYFNTVMYHSKFKEMRWELLPADMYVPGKMLHNKTLQLQPLNMSQVTAIHVSDTGNFQVKINRLHAINEWYFTPQSKSTMCQNAVHTCKQIGSCWQSLAKCERCKSN